MPSVLVTQRLRLIPANAPNLRDELDAAGSLAALLGLDPPPGVSLREMEEIVIGQARAALRDQDAEDWPFYYVVATLGGKPWLVGVVGYKGAPSSDGMVEIGYAVRADAQGQGFATEAAAALVDRAFACTQVRGIRAETLRHLEGSIRVLGKLGFRALAAPTGDILRFELRRPAPLVANP